MDEVERLEGWKANRKVRINRSSRVWKRISESDVTADEVGHSDGDVNEVIESTNDKVHVVDDSEDLKRKTEDNDEDGDATALIEDVDSDDVTLGDDTLDKRNNDEQNDGDVDTNGSDDEQYQSLDEDDVEMSVRSSVDDVLTDIDGKEICEDQDVPLRRRRNKTNEDDDEPDNKVDTNDECNSDNEESLLKTEINDEYLETNSVVENENDDEVEISQDCHRRTDRENCDTRRNHRLTVTRSAPPIPNLELPQVQNEESASDDICEQGNNDNVETKEACLSDDTQENVRDNGQSVSEPEYGFTFNDPLEDLYALLEEKRSSQNFFTEGQISRPSNVAPNTEIEEEYSKLELDCSQDIVTDSLMMNPGEVSLEEENGTEKEQEISNKEEVQFEEEVATQINTRALPRNATTYELEKFERNALIIFNFENINGYKPRLGTREDAEALRNTFGSYGFEIEEHVDLCRDDIFWELKRFSERDFTEHGCVAVAILTHGSDMGALKARDRSFYEMDVINFFKSQGRPTLVTKPKVIIIQACRGSKTTQAVHVMRAGKISTDNDDSGLQHYTLPVEADTLVLHSTYVGNTSHRDETHGSWFIQTLCRKINELAKTQDLETIITEVKREVAIDRVHADYNRRTLEIDYNKQMPVVTSTFIRKLYLKNYGEGVTEFDDTSTEDTTVEKSTASIDISQPDSEDLAKFVPCACFLDRFEYLRDCMRYFVEGNPDDETARSLLDVAEVLREGAEFNVAKEKISRAIRYHLQNNAQGHDYYKYLYLYKD